MAAGIRKVDVSPSGTNVAALRVLRTAGPVWLSKFLNQPSVGKLMCGADVLLTETSAS